MREYKVLELPEVWDPCIDDLSIGMEAACVYIDAPSGTEADVLICLAHKNGTQEAVFNLHEWQEVLKFVQKELQELDTDAKHYS